MTLINLSEKFSQISELVNNIEFKDTKLSDEFTAAYKNFVNTEKPNGYADVEWVDFSTKITTTSGKLVFVTNFWFYIAKELSDYLASLEKHKNTFKEIYKDADLKETAERLRRNAKETSYSDSSKIKDYFDKNQLSEEDLKNFISFVTDYDSWGGGKTIDRNDFYVSALLKAGNLLAETQSAIAEIARQFSSNKNLCEKFECSFIDKNKKPTHKTTRNHNTSLLNKDKQLLPKPFLLLAGISGTGKSRLVRQQAQAYKRADNFCLVAVRPDWHEPSDLLGYSSRLSGKTEYVATDVLRFLVAAWRDLLQWGMQLEGDGSQTQLVGNSGQLDSAVPFWLCLDEMNLAPVEQYFADYLSLIETRNWSWDSDDFEYSCDALLNASTLGELEPEQQDALARVLQLNTEDQADALLWQHFLEHGIAIPPNLIVAGTVNMDETTHGFSRKVIDRAMSFDFGEFFPNDFNDFYAAETKHEALTYPRHSSGKEAVAQAEGQPSLDFMQAINQVLKGSPFELAFRALNELLLAISCHQPKDAAEQQAVWDDFLMQKVLPRIEGDFEKLQGDETNNLLTRLRAELETQLNAIWLGEKARTDFYRYTEDTPNQPVAKTIECRSRRKIDWMLDRLKNHGFTSFWP